MDLQAVYVAMLSIDACLRILYVKCSILTFHLLLELLALDIAMQFQKASKSDLQEMLPVAYSTTGPTPHGLQSPIWTMFFRQLGFEVQCREVMMQSTLPCVYAKTVTFVRCTKMDSENRVDLLTFVLLCCSSTKRLKRLILFCCYGTAGQRSSTTCDM